MAGILDSYLNEYGSTIATESLEIEEDTTPDVDSALESELFLLALRDECVDDTEFAGLLEEVGVDLGLYGVLEDADAALEAAKKIVVKDFKAVNRNRLVKRACIRLAEKANDPNFVKYKKHRTIMMESRAKIFAKYESKAQASVRRSLSNSGNKAANMSTASATSVNRKIDAQLAKLGGQ